MKKYSREEIKELVKRYNNGEELAKKEMLAVAEFQVEILNPRLNQWEKWNKKAIELIKEILLEEKEVPTNKGMRRVLSVNGSIVVQCRMCEGTGVNHQRKNNKCGCITGWGYSKTVKLISEEEYKKKATSKYLKELIKKRQLSLYDEKELLEMKFEKFITVTGIRVL